MEEIRTCALSGNKFTLDEQDLEHYKKLNLPLPTLCPQERLRRRLTWRNDRTFYKRDCDSCKKSILSLYTPDSPYTIYCPTCWWSDSWDAYSLGRTYDFSRAFLEQYEDLMRIVPRLGVDLVNCENSEFCNYCGDDKNCYYDIAGEANEDCYYNLFTKYSKNSVDNTFLYHSTLCYECISCSNCYNCFYSTYCNDSNDLYFCYDMRGCNNCLFSYNLRNKEYYIMNEPYTKEEYFKKLAEFQLSTVNGQENARTSWNEYRKQNALHRDMYLTNTENCTGDMISNSKNTHFGFNATNCEDSKFLFDVLDAKDCYDLNYSLYKPELSTELISTLNLTYSAYNLASHYCSSIFYCDMCNNSKNLFGCIGINRGENCILNMKYSIEEYEDLKAKIIEQMKADGSYGEFFPMSLSPHAYNETVAQDYFPLTKDEALKMGLRWKDTDKREYKSSNAVIPDNIADAADSLSQAILACNVCNKNYKVIKQELAFYRQQQIPIPRECPECRHQKRSHARNPRVLFERTCSQCAKNIQSTFSPDQSEKVVCEECYRAAVY